MLMEGVLLCNKKEQRRLSHSECLLPGTQLHEANQELQFRNNAADLEHWLDKVEEQAASEDYGKGLADIQNLLRKHTLLESAVTPRQVGHQLFGGQGTPTGFKHTYDK